MKVRDLEKYIESTLKFEKFMNNEKTLKLKVFEDFHSEEYTSVKDMLEKFSDEFYGELTRDTELVNKDGYITATMKYKSPNWNSETKKLTFEENEYEIRIYFEIY